MLLRECTYKGMPAIQTTVLSQWKAKRTMRWLRARSYLYAYEGDRLTVLVPKLGPELTKKAIRKAMEEA